MRPEVKSFIAQVIFCFFLIDATTRVVPWLAWNGPGLMWNGTGSLANCIWHSSRVRTAMTTIAFHAGYEAAALRMAGVPANKTVLAYGFCKVCGQSTAPVPPRMRRPRLCDTCAEQFRAQLLEFRSATGADWLRDFDKPRKPARPPPAAVVPRPHSSNHTLHL